MRSRLLACARLFPVVASLACEGAVEPRATAVTSDGGADDATTKDTATSDAATNDAPAAAPNSVVASVSISGSAGSAEGASTAFTLKGAALGSLALTANLACNEIFLRPEASDETPTFVRVSYRACGSAEVFLEFLVPLTLGAYPTSASDTFPALEGRVGPEGISKRSYGPKGGQVEVQRVEGARIEGNFFALDRLSFHLKGSLGDAGCGALPSCASGGPSLDTDAIVDIRHAKISL